MWKRVNLVTLLLFAGARANSAQHIGVLQNQPGSRMKVDNGLIVSWRGASADPAANQIEIFDTQGRAVAALNVLRPVEGARSVSTYDVAVRPGKMIAVAAVYSKEDGTRPASALLYFDFSGKLRSMFALAPERSILQLAIDENSNVWTLTAHSGDSAPSEVPMIVEYDAAGQTVKQMLTRDMFPFHAEITDENSQIGSAEFGYQPGVLWFWLPGTTDFVTIRTSDGSVSMVKTDVPRADGGQTLQRLFRSPSGSLIAEVSQRVASPERLELAYYAWSPGAKAWTRLSAAACADHRLIGIRDDSYIFVQAGQSSSWICESALSPL